MFDQIRAFIGLIVVAAIAFAGLRYLVRNLLAGKTTEEATIVAFDVWETDNGAETYKAHFLMADGRLLTMRVKKEFYSGTATGSVGVLTHWGEWFISFRPTGMSDPKVFDGGVRDVPTIFRDSESDRDDLKEMERQEQIRREKVE